MNHSNTILCAQLTARRGRTQGGFTLVEILVATAIAAFLLAGLFASLQTTRRAYANQNGLAQLQDNQRLAMTLMSAVIEEAGYYPNPRTNTSTGVLTAVGTFGTAGQAVVGTANAAAPGDTITVRHAAAVNDNIFDCIGTRNTATAPYLVMVSQFQIKNNQLVCTVVVGGVTTDFPLVGSPSVAGSANLSITNMQIVYGIKAAGGAASSCTNSYQTSAQMVANPANWNLVCSVNITLTFTNPLQPAAAGIQVTRTIAVMNTAGVS